MAKHKAKRQTIELEDELTQRATAIVRDKLHGQGRAKHREPGIPDLPDSILRTQLHARNTARDAESALAQWKHDREGKD